MAQEGKVMFLIDLTFAILVPVVIFGLWHGRVITLCVVVCFLWGFLLGYIWESIHALVPNFIRLVDEQVEREFPVKTLYPLMHATADSVMFLLSMLLVYWLELPLSSGWALLVMVFWGITTELIVEFSLNGRYWRYNETIPGNPVLFRINGIGYTVWPFLEWLIAPVIFWAGANWICGNFGDGPKGCAKRSMARKRARWVPSSL